MPSNRILCTIGAPAAALAMAAALAGCGGGSSSTQAGEASTLTTTSSVTPATSATSAAASSPTSSISSTSASSTGAGSARSGGARNGKPAQTGGTAPGKPTKPRSQPLRKRARLAISSAAFPRGGTIPARYTCDGGNVSPPLRWAKVPAGTGQMFVLALSLTAGAQGAIRWAVGGLDPSAGGIPAGSLPPGAVAGRSSDGHLGWAGICPAHGRPQAVIVLVYALRNPLHLASGFDPRTVQSRLAGDTLGSGVVYGAYRRP